MSDYISRQALIDRLKENAPDPEGVKDWIDIIESMPSVTPTERIGHWIEKDGFDGDVYYDCSECGESWTTIEGTPWDNEWNYCPNCGCRMVEP